MGHKKLTAKRLSGILSLSAIMLALSGCGTIELKSSWLAQAITVDGLNSEWHSRLIYLEKAGILVGFANDATHLYACLVADSRTLRARILRQGLTAWFDPTGGSKKVLGLRFPIGPGQKRDRNKPGEGPEAFGGDPFEEEGPPDPEEMQEYLDQSLKELEIIGPGREQVKRIPVAEAPGIEIKLAFSGGLLVYELKVPLATSPQCPWAIGARPGMTIGVGLETPPISSILGRRGPGGGMQPRLGGMPGGGRFSQDPTLPEPPKGLNLWARINLAPAPGAN